MLLLVFVAKLTATSCEVTFNISRDFDDFSTISCQDEKKQNIPLTGYITTTTLENYHSILCYFPNENCDRRYMTGINMPICDEPYELKFEKLDVERYCFINSPFVQVSHYMSVDGFNIYAKDLYNNSQISIWFEHKENFSIETYFQADFCNTKIFLDKLSARKKGYFKEYKESQIFQICTPLGIRFYLLL